MRCSWAEHPELTDYHDTEWGRQVRTEHGLFERLCLESFQSGLSWLIILRKRPAFREAFAQFDPTAVSQFGNADVERLVTNSAIVRNRAKIDAAISNAQAVLDLDGQFVELVWSFAPVHHLAPATDSQIPATTTESVALSKALKAHGFRFFGPTTAYALMQAVGMVNDHVVGCSTRGD